MAAIIKIPALNPLRFYKAGTATSFNDLKSDFESNEDYIQKFLKSDSVTDFLLLQASVLTANYYPGSIWRVCDCDGSVVFSTSGIQGLEIGDSKIITLDSQDDIIAALGVGFYLVELEIKALVNSKITTTKYVSEWFEIVDEFPNSILLKYSHDNNNYDVAFYPTGQPESRQYFQLRVEGGMWSEGFNPSSKDTFYLDQQHDTILIDSIPFNTYKFTFGDGGGIPNWMADKINRIFSCSFTELNGKQYVKADGTKFEASRDKLYPFAGWQIELIEPELSASLSDDGTEPESVEGFGALYNWFVGSDEREVANKGWYVPTNIEQETLNSGGNNSNPFNVKPIGIRGGDGLFTSNDVAIITWAKNEYNAGSGYDMEIDISGGTSTDHSTKQSGLAIRLFRPATEPELEYTDGTVMSDYIDHNGNHVKTAKWGGKVWTENLKETKYHYKEYVYDVSTNLTESTTVTLSFTLAGSEYSISIDMDPSWTLEDIYNELITALDYLILNENKYLKAVFADSQLHIYQIEGNEVMADVNWSPVSPVTKVSSQSNSIEKVADNEAWAALTTGAYCSFNNNDNSL